MAGRSTYFLYCILYVACEDSLLCIFGSKYLDTHLWFLSPFLKKALANVTSTITAGTLFFPLSPLCLRVGLWGFLVGVFEKLLEDAKESEFFVFSCEDFTTSLRHFWELFYFGDIIVINEIFLYLQIVTYILFF